ncbi:MAG: COG1361 S-layer family protein [archaeon]
MKTVTFSVMMIMVLALMPLAFAATETSSQISISLVNQDPDPAATGNIVDLRLGVENLGGKAANNLIIELAPQYPFGLVPGDSPTQKISSINAYQSAQNMIIAKYKVRVDKDAQAGNYDLKVNYYTEGSNIIEHKTLTVAVGTKESAQITNIDKTLLVPGKETSLKITINNVGNAPLKDLKFSWENADKIILPVGSDNTRYIKYIDVDGSAEIEYHVIADTNAVLGLYQLDLYLTYKESATGTEKTISTIAGIYVGGGTDFDVAYAESSNGEISFSIANVGSNPANSVTVMIPEQRDYRVTGSNSFMIGNLNKGDYTVASFSLQSAANMTSQGGMNVRNRDPAAANFTQDRIRPLAQNSSTGALVIHIAYTDTMGERHIVEKEVNMAAQSGIASSGAQATFRTGGQRTVQSSFFATYGNYIIVIAILLVAFFIHREHRKRKLLDPGFKFRDFLKRKEKKRK